MASQCLHGMCRISTFLVAGCPDCFLTFCSQVLVLCFVLVLGSMMPCLPEFSSASQTVKATPAPDIYTTSKSESDHTCLSRPEGLQHFFSRYTYSRRCFLTVESHPCLLRFWQGKLPCSWSPSIPAEILAAGASSQQCRLMPAGAMARDGGFFTAET